MEPMRMTRTTTRAWTFLMVGFTNMTLLIADDEGEGEEDDEDDEEK